MGAVPAHRRLQQTVRFYEGTIGKKVVMAATGVLLFGFVLVHLLGNLQVYLGPEQLNHYSELLRARLELLWAARLILLGALVLHVVAAVQLTKLKNDARPVGYRKRESIASSYASRTMMWSGPVIFAFVVYHLMHFTWGNAHPDFVEGDVYRNVVIGFQRVPVSIAYVVAMVLLGMHLYHGLWSMFQTVGMNHPRYEPFLRRFAAAATVFIVAGNISIPVSVLAGVIR